MVLCGKSRTRFTFDQAQGTTRARLSNVKVKRKGQVTIPVELRERFKIQEGSLLEIHQHKEGILLRPAAPLQAGEVVGEEAYRKILRELASLRKKWR